jgi:hypothetical protein
MTGNGGGIWLHWSIENRKKINFEMKGNMLLLNKAGKNGGAIYYDLFSPKYLMENIYIGNEAKYGSNYASYPFCLKIIISETP